MKKKLAFLLCGTLVFSMSAPSLSAAAGKDKTAVSEVPAVISSQSAASSETEPSSEDMSRVLSLIKAKLPIPSSLTEFDYSFSSASSGSPASWRFSWSDKDYKARISVSCDSSANITNYSYRTGASSPYAPEYLQSELKSAADAFLKKAAPEVSEKAEYTGCDAGSVNSGCYTYRYVRMENGIPMPDNTASVRINFETGTVEGLTVNWLYDVSIPSSSVKLTAGEAADLISEKLSMTLSYRSKTDEAGKTQAYLVYEPDKGYISVDAQTGEVYLTKSEWQETGEAENMAKDTAMAGGTDRGQTELTEEETAKLTELKELISREAAIKAVTDHKELLLGDNLKSVTASLSNAGSQKDPVYIWNISFTDPTEDSIASKAGESSNARASVDAKTGKLLSFYSIPASFYDSEKGEWQKVTLKYSEKEAQKILETFLKTEVPDYFKNSKLTSSSHDYIATYENNKEVYGGYSFRYNRVNEDVEYRYDTLNGSVDGITGKIYSYRYSWNEDVVFESPKKAMSQKDALKAYLALDGYGLVYEINVVNRINTKDTAKNSNYGDLYQVSKEVRLVYSPNIYPSVISAFTGKQLDYEGNEYKADAGQYSYSDISGHAAVRSIRLLADIGVGFEGGKFNPDQAISEKEFMGLLDSLIYDYTESETYRTVSMSRETAIKKVIGRLGLDSIAKLKDIYKTSFTDEESFPAGFTGYAALAQGLKLTADFGGALNPNQALTRAEAASLLIKMLEASSSLSK